jgi:hypothetical protein
MGRETNIELIKALEKQIEEGGGDTIQLKRTRNSLLNISILVPPEILGSIFVQIVAQEPAHSFYTGMHFDGLLKGRYSFLLVCHHWFEVASSTPELWTFWGVMLEDWDKWYRHTGAAPIDLVLDYYEEQWDEVLSVPLQDALRNRATQDKIRQIHLRGSNPDLLASILSSLTPEGESVLEKHIQSITLEALDLPALSDFFSRSRLPKLRYLAIEGEPQAPLWEPLTSLATGLTTLTLRLILSSPPPTSQLLSILASHPNLRNLSLSGTAFPDDIDESGIRVPLVYLKTIVFEGEFRGVFGLINRLDLPATLDLTVLRTTDSTVEETFQAFGQYMRGCFQRNVRFKDQLNVDATFSGFANISVGYPMGLAPPSGQEFPYASFSATTTDSNPGPPMEKLYINLMALIPQAYVVAFRVNCRMDIPEELFVAMPNIELLVLSEVTLSSGFLLPNPEGPHANTSLLPSLRSLWITHVQADAVWEALTTFLAHQTSCGRLISLHIDLSPRMPPEVMERYVAWSRV